MTEEGAPRVTATQLILSIAIEIMTPDQREEFAKRLDAKADAIEREETASSWRQRVAHRLGRTFQ